jgi:carboxyl-terminal processing protease
MKIKRTIFAPLLVAVFAMATGGWFLQRGVGQERNIYANARMFEDVLRQLSNNFVDQKTSTELYQMALEGMLENLGDPHTSVMVARDYQRLRDQTQGEYGGIGVSIDKKNGWITVIAPLPGTPGSRAGLQAGDQIIEVNDEPTKDWTVDVAVSKLRGPKGSKVRINVARGGFDKPIPFEITREEIHIKAVPTAYMMDGNVGYVEMLTFSESSTQELHDAIAKLRSEGARGVILDLRRNPGGLLDQGSSVSDLFLERGQTIVETKGRVVDQNHKIVARDPDQFPGLPIVVLVGPGSASAAEIVAGALQDHDRALVVGRTTYGKGSVQTLYPLQESNWLKITTARWYTPVGRSIQKPYGIDAPHPVEGADSAAATKPETEKDKPRYKTASGRTVFGGGGIYPDLVTKPDTLTTQERAFLDELQKYGSEYTNVRLSYAVEYIRANPGIRPNFAVTPQMLEGFYAALARGGVKVDRAMYDRARRWVERDLGYYITWSKWGEQAGQQRANTTDPEVQAAAEILRGATTPQSLFAIAQRRGAQEQQQ